jgi:DNA-binding HxlR family transcriptional regulator
MRKDASRFSDLAARLGPVTPRALSATLKSLVASGLVERKIAPTYPPIATYAATESGRALVG